MIDSYISIYRVVKTEEDLWLVEDLLADQLHVAYAGEFIDEIQAQAGDYLAVRLFKAQAGYLVSPWDCSIDPELVDILVSTLQEEAMESSYPNMKVFLKQNSLLLMETLFEFVESSDMPPGPNESFFLNDAASVNLRLQAEPSFVMQSSKGEFSAYGWASNEKFPNILVIGPGNALMMSCDEEDLAQGKILFRHCCEEYITEEPTLAMDGEAIIPFALPFIQDCVIYKLVFSEVAMQLGRSPLEAVQEPWGRYQIEVLLMQMNYLSEEILLDLDLGLEEDLALDKDYFIHTARRLLGIRPLEEDWEFILVPQVIEEMIEGSRIDNRICIDPDRYSWSHRAYEETGRCLFVMLKNHNDELQLSLVLHAWDEYSGVYKPTVEEPIIWAAAVVKTFSKRLNLNEVNAGFFRELEALPKDYEKVMEISQKISDHFQTYPLELDDLEEYLIWEETNQEYQVVMMMDLCDLLTNYAFGQASDEAIQSYRQMFIQSLQSKDIEVNLDRNQQLSEDLEAIFRAWLAIDVSEAGQPNYLESYLAEYSDRLTGVEKQAMAVIAKSQLRQMHVETVEMDEYDDLAYIHGFDKDSQESIDIQICDVIDNALWFEGHTLMLRIYELDDVSVSWEPFVIDQLEDIPF